MNAVYTISCRISGIRCWAAQRETGMATRRNAGRNNGAQRSVAPMDAAAQLAEPKAKLTDLAYEMIEEAIVTLRIPPGTAISEQALSEMTGIGRTPIREAIQR